MELPPNDDLPGDDWDTGGDATGVGTGGLASTSGTGEPGTGAAPGFGEDGSTTGTLVGAGNSGTEMVCVWPLAVSGTGVAKSRATGSTSMHVAVEERGERCELDTCRTFPSTFTS